MHYIKLLLILLLSFSACAQDDWHTWLTQVKQEAREKGIRQDVIDSAFENIHEPNRTIKSLMKSQPEKRLSYTKYRSSRVDNYRIIIVDNASSDETLQIIKANFPLVEIIQNHKNIGFGRANNLAINQVKTNFALNIFKCQKI